MILVAAAIAVGVLAGWAALWWHMCHSDDTAEGLQPFL